MKVFRLSSIIISAFVLFACNGPKYESFTGYAQGGTYSVSANLEDVDVDARVIAAKIDSLLTEIDFSISGYNKNSLLSRYNAGEEITPDKHFTRLIELSAEYKALSHGAFDIAAGPLFDIWGFGFKNDSIPSAQKVEEALALCKEGKVLNFNAIAQGYSCDVIAEYLYSIGVKDMLVNIGEIYCDGFNSSGMGWSIGVDNPVDGNNSPGSDINGIWRSDGGAHGVVTSGNYRKYYIVDGKKYAHTIDPRTGYPVDHNLLSATILAPTAAMADALATACMVIGTEKSKDLINSLEGVEAYLISSDGTWTSEGFHIDK